MDSVRKNRPKAKNRRIERIESKPSSASFEESCDGTAGEAGSMMDQDGHDARCVRSWICSYSNGYQDSFLDAP